jgi:acyl carrier protein
MSTDSTLVDRAAFAATAVQVVADVMLVAPDTLRPETRLIVDLGAESIDFLDVVFRLEDVIGRRIPASHWGRFIHDRFGGRDASESITVDTVREFAEHEAALAAGTAP